MIVPSQPDYYVVTIDKSNQKIVVHHAEIIAWDTSNTTEIVGPAPITIFGYAMSPKFISHPTGVYTELATGVQYPTKVDFERVMQNLHDDELSKGE